MSLTTTSLIATITTNIPIRRALFLEEYIASNCTIEFDPNTSLDNTIGTYATNYLIGFVGVVLGILFVFKGCGCYCCIERTSIGKTEVIANIKPSRRIELAWQAIYFLLSAAGYSVAGVSHQIYQTIDELNDALSTTSYSLVILSMIALQLSVTETWRAAVPAGPTNGTSRTSSCMERRCTIILNLHYLIVAAILIATTAVFRTIYITGIYSFVVLAVMTAYYIRCCTRWHWMRYVSAFGNISILAGFLVAVLLGPSCSSSEAYENCFRDCPFPDPLTFNQNALFHTLVAVGMIFQGIGWWRGWPTENNIETTSSFGEVEMSA